MPDYYDDFIKLQTKLEMVRNALEAGVPHKYILAMLDRTPVSKCFFGGPFYGQMEEEDENDT